MSCSRRCRRREHSLSSLPHLAIRIRQQPRIRVLSRIEGTWSIFRDRSRTASGSSQIARKCASPASVCGGGQCEPTVSVLPLDTSGFEPNVFTTRFPDVNDRVQLTATGGNCGLSTVGAVRVVLEPKPGLPTDPNNPRAFIDVFTDISTLFVINNESGWYEGWMIHDMMVPQVNSVPRKDRHAQFGAILPADAAILKSMGSHNNVPGAIFTVDGNPPRLPSASDHFPDVQSNSVPLYVSMGAYNCLQQRLPCLLGIQLSGD